MLMYRNYFECATQTFQHLVIGEPVTGAGGVVIAYEPREIDATIATTVSQRQRSPGSLFVNASRWAGYPHSAQR